MREAPQDGTPIVLLYDDASAAHIVACLEHNGRRGWWFIHPDEEPGVLPYALVEEPEEDFWMPLPPEQLEMAVRYRDEQYGPLPPKPG
jgi:hypothetical protein